MAMEEYDDNDDDDDEDDEGYGDDGNLQIIYKGLFR